MRILGITILLIALQVAEPANSQEKVLEEYESLLKQDSTDSQGLSMIGMYEHGNVFKEIGHNQRVSFFKPKNQQIVLKDAYSEIYNQIKKNKIIILNEGHDLPYTRGFFYRIIDTLIANGYKNFFFETLDYDSSANSKKELTSMTGYYTNEVIGGEGIRKIFRLNGLIHHYEYGYLHYDTATIEGELYFVDKKERNKILIKTDSFLEEGLAKGFGRGRDTKQGLNILASIIKHPNEKYFIFCGYGHGARSFFFSYCLGNTLRHIFGEDSIFSIDQGSLTENGKIENEDSIYGIYSNQIMTPKVFKYRNSDKYVTEFKSNPNPYDMEIAHPRTRYIHNRASWYDLNGEKKYYSINNYVPKNLHGTDYLALVYYKDEYDKIQAKAVPADVMQVLASRGEHDFVLRPNRKYHLIVKSQSKKVVELDFETK